MNFDYTSVRDRLIAGLQATASWAQILPYSVNRRIIDVVATGISDLGTYDNYLTRESKWDLAQNTSSLVTNSKFLTYDVIRKSGASGNLRVSAHSGFAGTPAKIIPLSKYTTFSNGEDINFCTTGTNNILTTDNYIDIAVIQGTPTESTFTAAGSTYEEFEIADDAVENSIYDVYVNGVLWTEIADLNNASATDKYYTLKNKPNLDGVLLRFGNDIFGKKLIVGDTVLVKYVKTLGIDGNITSTGIIDTVVSSIFDIDGGAVTIYCTNLESLDGGAEEQTPDQIRSNGVDTFQAGDKIVSNTDYEIKLKAQSIVQNVVVWGAYEYNIINNLDPWTFLSSQENVVHVSAYTPAGAQLSTTQKNTLSALLNPDKPPEDIVQFDDVNFINLIFNVAAFVELEEYTLSSVKAAITTAITNAYDLTKTDFYKHVYDTAWKKIITDVAGVSYHNSYIQIAQYDTFDSAYVATIPLSIIDVTTSTVKIYAADNGLGGFYNLICTDNGSGGFTAESGYNVTGSTINYNTGAISLTVVSGLSEPYGDFSIKVIYQAEDQNSDKNILLTNVNQIVKIESVSNVTAQYTNDLEV
jgi:hypothetical protein